MKVWNSLALAGTICLAGCMTVDKAKSSRTGEEHILARNYGWELFNCVPIASGNASKDAWCETAFFRNDVTLEKVQARFLDAVGSREAYDVVFINKNEVGFHVFGIPIPYILCYNEIDLSGVVK